MLQNSQQFNDGIVKIYDVTNTAPDGGMPIEGITLKQTLRYKERTVGLTRRNFARQDNVVIKYVLRCPRLRDVSAQDIAIPNDGKQYRIWDVQYPEDIDPPVMDITLEEMKAVYDIYQPEPEEPDEPIEEPPDGGEPIEP
jgi:hypothetical protein